MSKKEDGKDRDPRKKPMTEDELDRAQVYDGEVRISLKTYHDLIASSVKADANAERFDDAIGAVSRYMTFLRSRENLPFDEIMRDFNKENPDLNMYVNEDGRVGFNLKLTS